MKNRAFMRRMAKSEKSNVKSYKLALTYNIHLKKICFLIISVFLCGLSSCATIQTTQEAKEQSNRAMDAFINCTLKFAPLIDDGYSDASTIALALTNRCINEYDAMNNAIGLAELGYPARQKFLRLRNIREEKIQASLNVVLENRNRLIHSKNK